LTAAGRLLPAIIVLVATLFTGAGTSFLLPILPIALTLSLRRIAEREQYIGLAVSAAVLAAGQFLLLDMSLRAALAILLGATAAPVVLLKLIGRVPARAHAEPPVPEPRMPPPEAALADAIEGIRKPLGAERAVLWLIDLRTQRARPWVVAAGRAPAAVGLGGDVLGWVAREGLCMRVDVPPLWAEQGTTAAALVPVRGGDFNCVLSLEYAKQPLPEVTDIERAAAFLAILLGYEHGRRVFDARSRRLDELQFALDQLPGVIDPAQLALGLGHAASSLAGATGCAVALWDGAAGEILASHDREAVPVGARFAAEESLLAMAARNGAMIVRDHWRRERDRVPFLFKAERFSVEPRAVAAVPLIAMTEVVGVLGFWSDDDVFDPEALRLVDTLAKYAANQLRIARRYGHMRELADHDRLTSLHNRQAFDHAFEAEAARFDRYGRPFSIILFDIDHFKSVNDRFGHPAGDAVIVAVAQTLTRTLRGIDFSARYGGEEFVVLLQETPLQQAADLAERIRHAIESTATGAAAQNIAVTCSFGVAAAPECSHEPRALVKLADDALYRSKQAGRNRVTVAPRLGG